MTTQHTIDDAMLSAYLDNELAAQDMRAVSEALAADPVLATRFNALQMADELVRQHARALDDIPLRPSTLALLQTDSGKVVPINRKVVNKSWRNWTPVQRALAAGIVVVVAVVSYLRDPATDALPALAAYAAQLDTVPSGTTVNADAATLNARFSFRDGEGRYCRQYQLRGTSAAADNIACRTEQGWALVASLPLPLEARPDAYQPASSSAELNALLDTMMQGAALDLATEANLIESGWQSE
jgi:hypothetical protein